MPRRPDPAKPADPLNIPLGTCLKEEVTGAIGIAIMKSLNQEGNIRYALQPQGDGTIVPEALWFDWHTLWVMGPGVSASIPPITKPTVIRMGEEVKHKISGVTGIVVEMVGFMNGCQHLVVQAQGKKAEDKHFRTEDGVDMWIWKSIGMAPALPKPVAEPVGGPMTRIARPVARRF